MPRSRNWRKPRACLICPNTGSTICFLNRYRLRHPARFNFRRIPWGQRAADLSLDVGRVLGASRRDVSLDDARLEAREVGFAQISAVGGGLPGAATEIGLDAVEEGHELSMVAHR